MTDILKRLKRLIKETACLSKHEISTHSSSKDFMSKGFVINMTSRTERLDTCRKTLSKVGISWTRFSAIIGKDIEDEALKEAFNILRPGELGCLLSHLLIAYIASNHPDPNSFTLVFEDDVVTSAGEDSWKSALVNTESIHRKEGLDLIYFGKCLERCGQMIQIKDNIYRAVAPSCCHAYAIRNGFAKKMLTDLQHCSDHPDSILNSKYFNRGIDSIYGDYIINGMAKAVVFHPALFYQDVLSGGGSDLRQEYMINYQECNDTNPPCTNTIEERTHTVVQRKKSDKWIILLLIIILVVLIIVLLGCQRKKIGPFMRGRGGIVIAGVGLGLFGLICLAAVIVILVHMIRTNMQIHSRCREPQREWMRGFPTVEQCTLTPMLRYSRKSVGSREFILDKTHLASKQYTVFNPNGFFYEDRSRFDPKWSGHHRIFISSSRCFNGKNSYPLIRIYDSQLNTLVDSKIVLIESHKAMREHQVLGYEDMRIFLYKNKPYLIGVNLDRSEKNMPSMFMVRLDWNFKVRDSWHLKYEPLAAFPNKNWAPMILPDGELGLLVDIDPLLIVGRRVKGRREKASRSEVSGKKIHTDYAEDCELLITASKQTSFEKVRNSSIVYRIKDLDVVWRDLFEKLSPMGTRHRNFERYVLLGHAKFVESDYVRDAPLVLYQHHLAIVDIPLDDDDSKSEPIVWLSKPFHMEKETRPHIEYVSGLAFREDEMIVTYGLEDSVSKYQVIDVAGLEELLR